MSVKDKLQAMREGGRILDDILSLIVDHAGEGVTGLELDALARKETLARNARPAFLGFNGFPSAICVSKNSAVVHGIPSAEPFKEGDLVSLDFGILFKGWYTDAARTVIIGKAQSGRAEKLVNVCEDSFYKGMDVVHGGVHVGDIGSAIQEYVESNGFGVVRSLVGHGVGKSLHEEPRIPNFGMQGTGPILRAGDTIAVEPMITAGSYAVRTARDGWTVETEDGSLAAHYENTIMITDDGYEILTESR